MEIEVCDSSHHIRFKKVLNEIKKEGENEFSLDLGEYSINVIFGGSEDKVLFLKHPSTHCLLAPKSPDISVNVSKGKDVILEGKYSYSERVSDTELIISFQGGFSVYFDVVFFPEDSVELEKLFEEVF